MIESMVAMAYGDSVNLIVPTYADLAGNDKINTDIYEMAKDLDAMSLADVVVINEWRQDGENMMCKIAVDAGIEVLWINDLFEMVSKGYTKVYDVGRRL